MKYVTIYAPTGAGKMRIFKDYMKDRLASDEELH